MSEETNDPPPILKRKDYGFGKDGRNIVVKANFFEVNTISKFEEFFKYNIEINSTDNIEKEVESEVKRERSDYEKNIRRKVLKKISLKKFQDIIFAYDGGSTLYTTKNLEFNELNDAKPIEIVVEELQNTKYDVTISRSDAVIKLTQLKEYIKGEKFKWDFFSDEAFNVLNSLIHKIGAESQSYTQSGKSSIYNKELKKIIKGGIELWPGWFSAVRPGQGSLFINVNPTFSAFYQSSNLDDFLLQCFQPKYRNLPNEFNNFEMKRINKVLRGLLVRLQHLEPMQPERRIRKLLTTKQAARFKYKPKKDSNETPLGGYFNDKKEKYYKDNNQPRKSTKFFVELMSNEDIKIAWPIEFCKIIEGQRYSNRKLTGTQQGEIILAAKRRPSLNESETIKGAKEILQLQNDPIGIGMKVLPNLTTVDARVLESTDIKYAGKTMKPINGQWNLKNMRFVESGERLEFWHVISFEQNRWMPENEAINFIENLARQCEQQGMNIAKVTRNMPAFQYLQYRGHESVKKAYNDAVKKLNRPPQMILFIIPGEKSPINTELYETIKRVMDTDVGCLSQCVSVDSKRNFRSPQYCANLSMKMNLKLGGVNSNLPEENLRLPNGDEVLFLGADVTHPKDKTGRSICAVVGSLDNQAARYVTKYRDQERSGREEILKIDEMIKEILEEYCEYQQKKKNIKKNEIVLPLSIIMYRDGVSESQFERVLKFELPKIKEACDKFRQGYKPKVIFSVVGKRHHTRIYPINPQNGNEADRNGNCLVGTVVDKKITHPTLNDFYLQSHYANQGTARPSHYTILHDDIKLTVDQFQSLSNTLCYNFQRATSSVSIPSPTYYAHVACTRAKMYLITPNKAQKGSPPKLLKLSEKLKKYPMYFM
ncbi:hypothetical protein RclHR1_01050010 [Rhizophagus clarus]|uniref:Piwi domain-containing protein n=1 Tax=Rhizophagus clarus TaxID=94130 RepID=A0A2Z6QU55_9GLOM|nr:hypothetical protein RclHR1_01050010 [Rhizophagus clarus]GES73898.1 piwi domain-containing protein [Rhizophagus clarus]